MKKPITLILATLVVVFSTGGSAHAQKREVGLLLGGINVGDRDIQSPQSGRLSIGAGLTYQVNYAQRLIQGRPASLYFEVHLAATPSTDVKSSNVTLPRNYASLFITPGVRLKFRPQSVVSPYVAVGGGYARFDESDFRINDQPNTGQRGTNRGVFDFGGGVDVKIWRFLSLRGELRDFVSGNPNFNVTVSGNRQHNVLTSGGFVLRF
jgi:outer membrane autotransporter protein